MNLCANKEAHEADAELAAIYEKLMDQISPEGRVKLRAAQDAWVAYRRQECEFETAGTAGGSVHPMIVSECYASIASGQIKNLRHQFECVEGDLSCVRQ